MKFWNTKWFHAVATAVCTAGVVAAHVLIPATAAVAVGPVSVPVSALVVGGLALAASQGITPNRQIAAAVESAVVKKDGS